MSTYNPVYRAIVTFSDSTTGKITVRIPALTGTDSTFDISYIGRASVAGSWKVPAVGDQIVVAADDANFTNTFWVQTDTALNLPLGFVTNGMLAGSISQDKLAGNIGQDKLAGGIPASKLASYPKLIIPHTFAVNGLVSVAVGQYDYISPFFVKVPSTQTVKLISARHRINAGTSATVKVQINGADAAGFTGMSVTTTSADTDPTDITINNNDVVSIVVTAVSGSPQNMSVSLFFEYTWVG